MPTPVTLPNDLLWVPTNAHGNRHGSTVDLVVVHRWGVRYVNQDAEASSYHGVVNYFKDVRHSASAHIVYPGSSVPDQATQMVSWNDYAWAEAAYNPVADEIESADAIWLGKDPRGFTQLARIVAFRLHERKLPPVWSSHRGFCRHADLGMAGGGHTECPTTNLILWKMFCEVVQRQYFLGGFRAVWGR